MENIVSLIPEGQETGEPIGICPHCGQAMPTQVSLPLAEVKEIIAYLNERTGTAFKISSRATQSKIKARLREGFTVKDFKSVIDKKCDDWLGTDYEKFLRPETLFGTKFESYVQQRRRGDGENRSSNGGFGEKDYRKGVW